MRLRPTLLLLLCLTTTLHASCSDNAREATRAKVDGAKAKVSTLKARARARSDAVKDSITPMLTLSPEEFDTRYDEALAELQRYDQGMRRVVAYAAAHPELFPKDDPRALPQAQRAQLLQIWRATLDHMRALDGIKSFWRSVHLINPVTRPDDHRRAFHVAYLTWLIQYRHGLSIIDLTVPSRTLETMLDEPSPDIPPRAFAALKKNVLSVEAITRFFGSHQYWRLQREKFSPEVCPTGSPCAWGVDLIATYKNASLTQLGVRGAAEKYSFNTFDIARDFTFTSWFPVQKEVAEWMGDTKVHRLHSYLIDSAKLEKLRAALEPADIVVSRKNWYLSNIGLPGFWPHAALYLGPPDQLTAYFAGEDLAAKMPELAGHADLPSFLQATYPDAWEAYTSRAKDGSPNLMLEAMSEGVLFTPSKVAFAADYIGVMRARRSRVDKARAVLRAFQYFGRPYDFNFDFVSDASIVCTELVFKAWQRGPQHAGLDIELVDIMGRATLPANELVRQFAAQASLPEDTRQLDFVSFVDGLEKDRSSHWGDAASFSASWERPQWDIAQE